MAVITTEKQVDILISKNQGLQIILLCITIIITYSVMIQYYSIKYKDTSGLRD